MKRLDDSAAAWGWVLLIAAAAALVMAVWR
jgi:hypothetical protein